MKKIKKAVFMARVWKYFSLVLWVAGLFGLLAVSGLTISEIVNNTHQAEVEISKSASSFLLFFMCAFELVLLFGVFGFFRAKNIIDKILRAG